MNLRGTVIPIMDLARKLGMKGTEPTARSAIVVADAHGAMMGLLVASVSDILTLPAAQLQPVPEIVVPDCTRFSDGITGQPDGRICFLNLERMFGGKTS